MGVGPWEMDSLVPSGRYYVVFFLVVVFFRAIAFFLMMAFFVTVFFLVLLEDFLGVDLAVPLEGISFVTFAAKSSAGSRERFFPFMGYSNFSCANAANRNAGVLTDLP